MEGVEKMPKGIFFQCETCGQKVFQNFPSTWIHISNLLIQVGKGIYKISPDSFDRDYNHYSDLTFCSLPCFIDWLKTKFPDANNSSNPSQRV
jgi:hypothetical protein